MRTTIVVVVAAVLAIGCGKSKQSASDGSGAGGAGGAGGSAGDAGAEAGVEAGADADASSDAPACCPIDPGTPVAGCAHLGGSSVNNPCGQTCDFFCTTNWRMEHDDHGCPIWRYDYAGPDGSLSCVEAGVFTPPDAAPSGQ